MWRKNERFENNLGGEMTDVLTSAQMRAIEAAAIASGKVTGLELMERAGRGVVEAILAEWSELAHVASYRTGTLPAAGRSRTGGDLPTAPGYLEIDETRRAVVLCGPGNNGGDGFVIARLLKTLGWEVKVFLYGDPERLPPDARVNYERWKAIGSVQPYETRSLLQAGADAVLAGVDQWLIVDALFGIGQRAPLDEMLAPVNALIDATTGERAAPIPFFIPVDVPTGYDADTGKSLALRPMPADLIVTFHSRKPVHCMPHMADVRCVVVDIGL